MTSIGTHPERQLRSADDKAAARSSFDRFASRAAIDDRPAQRIKGRPASATTKIKQTAVGDGWRLTWRELTWPWGSRKRDCWRWRRGARSVGCSPWLSLPWWLSVVDAVELAMIIAERCIVSVVFVRPAFLHHAGVIAGWKKVCTKL